MRQRLASAILTALLGLGIASSAAATPIVMITQYVETWGLANNALEISNVGSTGTSLAGYSIDIYNNGSLTPWFSVALDPVWLVAGTSWVVTTTSASDPDLLAVADQFDDWLIFSGDDAIVLSYLGTAVDSIGQVGVDPGLAWGTSPETTRNMTLHRDASMGPDTNPSDGFAPATTWSGTANGDYVGMGAVPEPATVTLLLGASLLYALGSRKPRNRHARQRDVAARRHRTPLPSA